MKTLVFCTGWSNTQNRWNNLYGRWIRGIKSSMLEYDQILIPDDGSLVLPSFSNFEIISENLPLKQPSSNIIMYHWKDHLGRKAGLNYPGWHRSFMFASNYAKYYGFEKVIHIESDAFLISKKIQGYINGCVCGWIAFYCPRHRFPESAIQVISGNSLDDYIEISKKPYKEFTNILAERYLPFSNVQHGFKGDRYSEYLTEVPKDADYACQIHENFPCWWL